MRICETKDDIIVCLILRKTLAPSRIMTQISVRESMHKKIKGMFFENNKDWFFIIIYNIFKS